MLERPKLLWFGRPPSEEDLREAKNHDVMIEVVGRDMTPNFRYAGSAVFWCTSPHVELAVDLLDAHMVSATDEGLQLFIVVENDVQRRDVQRIVDEHLKLVEPLHRPTIRLLPVGPHEAPIAAIRHNPGPAANDHLELDLQDGVTLEDDQLFLLRRAFSDCKAITLKLISGGKSGAATCLIDARLSDSNAGPRPTLFFAKLYRPDKLRDEFLHYKEFAEHHIAWNLRPNFIPERCIYGVSQGILVGNLVEPSQSLWEAARAGNGPMHIRTLFEETLGVWRSVAQTTSSGHSGSVVEPLRVFCQYDRIPSKRMEDAKLHGERIHLPRSLWNKLRDLPSEPWRQSAMHGDMHGDNVRIRKQDAIVIDFAHSTTGPMCADLASLEVWLAFKVLPGEALDRAQWHKRVEELYRPEVVNEGIEAKFPEPSGDWVRSCLQEIRRIAGESTLNADEYKRVLAVYLLRHASFPPDEGCEVEDEYRRTYAYWLANRMVNALCAAAPFQLEDT